jgi:hypothetical protein
MLPAYTEGAFKGMTPEEANEHFEQGFWLCDDFEALSCKKCGAYVSGYVIELHVNFHQLLLVENRSTYHPGM